MAIHTARDHLGILSARILPLSEVPDLTAELLVEFTKGLLSTRAAINQLGDLGNDKLIDLDFSSSDNVEFVAELVDEQDGQLLLLLFLNVFALLRLILLDGTIHGYSLLMI